MIRNNMNEQKEEIIWFARYCLKNAKIKGQSRKERLSWITLAHEEIKQLKKINRIIKRNNK